MKTFVHEDYKYTVYSLAHPQVSLAQFRYRCDARDFMKVMPSNELYRMIDNKTGTQYSLAELTKQ